ncbi:MAG: hypothetical protein H6691_03520 [Gemmatimonadales bacterium]|nr:hypothetical protein [Gemmatimonadales bacterium]
MSRRDALQALGALFALPLTRWPEVVADPLVATILDFQAGRARGEWTAAELTARAIERSYAWNRALHATDLLSDRALAEARASDARARRGALRGPLDGVPVFAKSIYDMAGLPTTASSAAWSRLFPEPVRRDAIEVARLREAGAVVLGKTVADDFAYRGNGTSSLSGQVANPHDASGTRTPGGSSAGSAVAVACGMAFAALGTDDGGSNRIPAQFTGVVGMKPTFGLVPRTGVIPTWPFLDTHGPLARTVADAALLLDAIAGPDGVDWLATMPHQMGGLAGLRDDALSGARLGLVEVHVPRSQMPARPSPCSIGRSPIVGRRARPSSPSSRRWIGPTCGSCSRPPPRAAATWYRTRGRPPRQRTRCGTTSSVRESIPKTPCAAGSRRIVPSTTCCPASGTPWRA